MISNKKEEASTEQNKKTIWEMLDSSFEEVKKSFILFYDDTNSNNVDVNSNGKYFRVKVKIENYNIEIDGRNFYDQPIND